MEMGRGLMDDRTRVFCNEQFNSRNCAPSHFLSRDEITVFSKDTSTSSPIYLHARTHMTRWNIMPFANSCSLDNLNLYCKSAKTKGKVSFALRILYIVPRRFLLLHA